MAKGGTQQVAALPWRPGERGVEILLVTTRTTKRWVIPKGWPMDDKPDHQAAAQEAFEEAGVRGRISPTNCGSYGYLKISDKGKARPITVAVFALRVDQELSDWPERGERDRRWMTGAEACARAGEPDLVLVIQRFMDHPPEESADAKGKPKSLWQRLWMLLR
jgi:8-oxo-dGTP pyrophosphatase MutT (NUDIX family)